MFSLTKLNRRRSWLTFAFAMGGAPAMVLVAVLPTMHAPGCACGCALFAIPIAHETRSATICPACIFNAFTTLALPEALAVAARPCGSPWYVAVCEAAAVCEPDVVVNRAHSPPAV